MTSWTDGKTEVGWFIVFENFSLIQSSCIFPKQNPRKPRRKVFPGFVFLSLCDMVKEEGNQCAGMGEISSISRNQCAIMVPDLCQWNASCHPGLTSLEERELIFLMRNDVLFIMVARQ
ncbi:hypothetical protein CDAR_111211 [Caerostris darwini]|uniref:Uncharacterized protein n=1 Tax=Caerostris darwini TaxID=1538125 RepID=A0AAV4SUL4_9ARAC|nr:hypothetical protein CDAR_111211 [Caerostris darwini]